MPKPPKDDLAEAKRIAAKMLAMPPAPRREAKPKKTKRSGEKRQSRKSRKPVERS